MKRNHKTHTLFFLFFLCLLASLSFAQVNLSVTKKVASKMRVAVSPFQTDFSAAQQKELASRMGRVLVDDLQISGYFSALEDQNIASRLKQEDLQAGRILFSNWRQQGIELLVTGDVSMIGDQLHFNCSAHSLNSGLIVFKKTYKADPDQYRRLMHQVADDLTRQVSGEEGLGASRIAFVSNLSGSKQIYVADWDGYNRVQLTQSKQIALYPKWAQHASLILCTDYATGRPQITALDLQEQVKRAVLAQPGLNAFARFSPDGKRIVLTLSQDGNPEIYTCQADGRGLRRLTRTSSVESSPSWSPDGKKIIFVSDRSGTPQVYQMNSDGTHQERLTFSGTYNTSPELSPNGKWLAYCSLKGGRFQIYILDMETKQVKQVTDDFASNEDPTWGPSGRHLAYTSTKNYASDIYLIDIYDQHPIRLTKDLGDCSSPSWSRPF